MATKSFEKRFALKEATETFLSLLEGFNPSVFCVEFYGNALIELRAQLKTQEEKRQFIQTAKTMVTKGVEFECYFNRTIKKYCIGINWRLY